MKDTQKTNKGILLVTTEASTHASLLEEELDKCGAIYHRFNTDTPNVRDWPHWNLSRDGYRSVVLGDASKSTTSLDDFSAVWWDEVYPVERLQSSILYEKWAFLETQKALCWILGSLDAVYINSPTAIVDASNKVVQLQRARNLGFEVPTTIISSNYDLIREFTQGEAIYKPMSRPTPDSIGDDRLVLTTLIHPDEITRSTVSCKMSLFQHYVEKRIEIRTYVIGDKVLSAEIHSQESDRAKIDWRNYDIANTPHYQHKLPPDVENACIGLTKSFGLVYSAIDMIVTPRDEYVFLELNPQGLWGWIERLTGIGVSFTLAQELLVLSQNQT